MYPQTFFSLFPPFPRDERAFVAMSFDKRFDARWTEVLEPAIASVTVNDVRLEPHRVDLTSRSDSIITEILDEIARCRLFVADVTTMGFLDNRPVRNQNVFYELGLAHATRQPEEVLLLRSDTDDLAFDVSNVRVHSYDPDGNPAGARALVSELIVASSRELQLRRHLAVRRAAERLDYASWVLLVEAQNGEPMRPPAPRNMGEVLGSFDRVRAIDRLLDTGAIRCEFVRVTAELLDSEASEPGEGMLTFRLTPFGSALFEHIAVEMGVTSPELRPTLEALAAETTVPPG